MPRQPEARHLAEIDVALPRRARIARKQELEVVRQAGADVEGEIGPGDYVMA
jgi:hypothetical protein